MVVGWAGYDGRRSLDRSSHDVCFGVRYVVSVFGVVVVVVVNWLCVRRRGNISSLRCGLGGLSIGRRFGKARPCLPCDSLSFPTLVLASAGNRRIGPVSLLRLHFM
jgi:hypothetical protein